MLTHAAVGHRIVIKDDNDQPVTNMYSELKLANAAALLDAIP